MAEYVEREDIFNKKVEVPLFGKMAEMVAVSEIQRIPAADVRPVVHARWDNASRISRKGFEWFKCSNCGMEWSNLTNFCPNCGADMREAKT